MVKGLLRFSVVIMMAMVLSGCTVRAYKQVRERVDQNIAGNAGYISGTAVPEDRSEIKKTRMTYVVEVTKKDKKLDQEIQAALDKPVEKPAPSVKTVSDYSSDPDQPNYGYQRMSSFEEEEAPTRKAAVSSKPSATNTYTVQKGDTLQKISKQFYNSFAQWNRIYEANKDKIANPNRIKPGTVLTIP